MCIAWIGVVAYQVTWLITIIGYTIQVPDTVMGLSFLAVGTFIYTLGLFLPNCVKIGKDRFLIARIWLLIQDVF